MRIDVADILHEPGASFSFDLTGSEHELSGLDIGGQVQKGVRVRGIATSLGNGVYVEANVVGSLKLQCSRCLTHFIHPFNINCEARFMESLQPEGQPQVDDETREPADDIEEFLLDGTFCDLDEMIGHEIILNLPMKPLCTAECKGLCPVCGKDLNDGPCDCQNTPTATTRFGEKLLRALKERGE